MKKAKKKSFALALIVIISVLITAAAAYMGYVLLSYNRIENEMTIETGGVEKTTRAEIGREYTAVTWNLGFGAYSADYTFFMDGGEYSRAYSRQAVLDNINGAIRRLSDINADIILLQEIDINATRSWHVDEKALLESAFGTYSSAFAVNYDSPYLLYPLLSPHGKSLSGLETFSSIKINSAARYCLPVEKSLYKLFDLDRCYTKSRLSVGGGGELVIYNIHLSAYTSDGTIATKQLEILTEDMRSEYRSGSYIICGGDFNKDLYGNSSEIFGVKGEDFTWTQPIKAELIKDGIFLVDTLDVKNPVPSCRNPDIAYKKGESFVVTVDGFIVSENVEITGSFVADLGFEFSDHNPVCISFRLR